MSIAARRAILGTETRRSWCQALLEARRLRADRRYRSNGMVKRPTILIASLGLVFVVWTITAAVLVVGTPIVLVAQRGDFTHALDSAVGGGVSS